MDLKKCHDGFNWTNPNVPIPLWMDYEYIELVKEIRREKSLINWIESGAKCNYIKRCCYTRRS